jgi:hypothetical protein
MFENEEDSTLIEVVPHKSWIRVWYKFVSSIYVSGFLPYQRTSLTDLFVWVLAKTVNVIGLISNDSKDEIACINLIGKSFVKQFNK